MLLAQPFDPFKEKRLPFFARCRIISRTRQALFDLKNKMHSSRQFQPNRMMPDHHYMLPQQPPLPWFCYNCCYDPYFFHPPPPHIIQPICLHFSPPPDSSSFTESTIYSTSSNSMYHLDEKEPIQVEESRPKRQPGPVMNRSQSEIISSRPRPSVSRWNTDHLYE